ncbi:hypothetical protein SAMN04515618_11836 [Collimonas sp. OK307]|nr:hypothetical protein SAMN04515618_11836 [Collimonas sp. OK307]
MIRLPGTAAIYPVSGNGATEAVLNLSRVKATYSFSSKHHHASVEQNIAVSGYVESEGKPRLQILET